MTMPYYVAPEQVMKDRAEYAQKGIARGRSLVATTYDRGIVIVADNPSRSLHKISEIYDRIAFAGVGKYNEFDQLRVVGHPPRRHQGLRLQPRGRGGPVAGQPLRPVPRAGLHPRDEAARGGDPGGRARQRPAAADSCTTSPTRAPSPTRTGSPSSAARPRPSPSGSRRRGRRTWTLAEALRAAWPPWPVPTAPSARTTSRSAVAGRGQRPPGLPPPRRRGARRPAGLTGVPPRRPGERPVTTPGWRRVRATLTVPCR